MDLDGLRSLLQDAEFVRDHSGQARLRVDHGHHEPNWQSMASFVAMPRGELREFIRFASGRVAELEGR